MFISGMGTNPYISSYSRNVNATQPQEETIQSVNTAGVQEQTVSNDNIDTDVSNPAPRNSNPTDFTFDFKKHNNFNLVGATNKLEDMDVNKAVNDMKKEDVLDQYKFFVQPSKLGTDSDGTVRLVMR